MDYSKRLVEWCNKICDIFGWDREQEEADYKEKGRRTITVSENLRKAVYKAKEESILYYGRNISKLHDSIINKGSYSASFVDALQFDSLEDFTEEGLKEKFDYATVIKELIELYQHWENNEFKDLVTKIAEHHQFKDPDFNLHPSILEEINEIVIGKKFKLYNYVDTGEKLHSNDKFFISSQVGFSSDVTMWLDHIRNQSEWTKTRESDEVYVTLYGKIDEVHPIYSNWIFTIHKKGTIWLCTDQIGLDNPYQKRVRLSRNGLYRDRYEHQDSCDLPFYLFEDIPALREKYGQGLTVRREMKTLPFKKYNAFELEKRELIIEEFTEAIKGFVNYDVLDVKNTGSGSWAKYSDITAKEAGRVVAYWQNGEDIIINDMPEVFVAPLEDFKDGERAFILLLVNELIQFYASDGLELETVSMARDFIDQKLLEGATMNPVETTKLSQWNDNHKEIFNEINETLEDLGYNKKTEANAVAVQDFSLVLKNKYYNRNWIAPAAKLESLSEWMILEEEADKLREGTKMLDNRRGEDEKALLLLFQTDFYNILKRIQAAKNITFDIYKTFTSYGFDSDVKKKNKAQEGYFIPHEVDGIDSYRNIGIGRMNFGWEKSECICCEQRSAKTVHKFYIRHYKQLMFLLGYTERRQLPPYYRNYKAHDLIPYGGNSILDQTHPYNRIIDPCSKTNSNGITFYLMMCKVCYNKLQWRAEELTIEI